MQKYLIVIGFVLVLCAPMLLAGKPQRDGNKENRRGRTDGCRYKTVRTEGANHQCDPTTNTRTVTKQLVSGDPTTCQPTSTIQMPCKNRRAPRAAGDATGSADPKCKYRKGQKGECNAETRMRTITLNLKRNSPPSCAPTKQAEKPCRPKPARPEKGDKRRNGRPNRRRGNDE